MCRLDRQGLKGALVPLQVDPRQQQGQRYQIDIGNELVVIQFHRKQPADPALLGAWGPG